jgi:DNA replication and repair protein RecF
MGKTNLLDAIYYLSFCKSHSNSIDSQNIMHDAEFFMLRGNYRLSNIEHEVSCAVKRRSKKQFGIDKKEYDRLADHIGALPLVLVSPADSQLIEGGSDERRKFIDGVISQYDKNYLQSLLHYNNALKQRNALLKSENIIDETIFDILEEQMLEFGEYIYRKRESFINDFIPVFQQIYERIAQSKEQILLTYNTQYHRHNMAEYLKEKRQRDKLIGYSSVGIHKDDLELLLDNFPIKRTGSQGQNKTCLVALKLAQHSFLRNAYNFSPILLLDDIFDKLDAKRVYQIVQYVASEYCGQIFITDTNRTHLDSLLKQINQEYFVFAVENGNFQKL